MIDGRFFHLYANGKTVKELDYDTFLRRTNRKNWLLVSVFRRGIGIIKDGQAEWIPRKQLEQILEASD